MTDANNSSYEEDIIREYVISNIDTLIGITYPLYTQKNSLISSLEFEFHSDIQKQFNNVIKWTIAKHLSDNLNIKLENTIIFVENYDNFFHNKDTYEVLYNR
jgi:hypothetical protein